MNRPTACLAAGISCLIAVALAAGPARAVVVDPDAFPHGAVINNSFPGVTLTALGSVNGPNVLALDSIFPTTGTRVFGFVDDSPLENSFLWGDGTIEELRADFANGASSVSLDFVADDSGGDSNAVLRAFNQFDVEVDIDFSASNVPLAQGVPLTLTVSAPNIAYITATWDTLNQVEHGILDNLVYTPVPEPTALVLSSFGALLIRGALRRQRIQTRGSSTTATPG